MSQGYLRQVQPNDSVTKLHFVQIYELIPKLYEQSSNLKLRKPLLSRVLEYLLHL